MIGETTSHYRIIEQLGEGGMGVVYLAEDINLGRLVAMKFLTSTAPEYRARFLREAQAVSLLHHQNIAAVFDYGETPKGQPYIVMELIKGEPLSEKLRGGSLPLPEAVRIVCSIAEALGEAHLQRVVHRDIKPSNVIINERGQVKVVDFGLVKQILEAAPEDPNNKRAQPIGAETRSDVIVGTPLYLSPEQATGKTVDGRSDLFALGAVLYECLTGVSAFSGDNVIEIGAQVIHVNPPVPSQLNEHVPPTLDRITMKAMEKKIEARYQSANELIADLSAILPSLEADGFRKRVRSTHPAAPARTHSASALTTLTETLRQPRLSWGAVVIAVLALGLVVWGLIWWNRPVPYKPSAASLEFYNTGTEAVRNGEFLQASRALQEATKTDPNFPLAHARLAEAWFELDYQDKATNETLNAQRLVPNRSELPVVDALYLDAINATATRDFAGAINHYSAIVHLSPDEPHLYVDLGRAYEKNDEPKRAIESYLIAIARSPKNPTPYLRLGVLYGDQVDIPKAMANFDTAQNLFEALGKFEGQAEVAFQRGALFDRQGKPAQARPYLERALELAKTTASQYQEVKTLLTLGNVAVDENKFAQARNLIQQGIDKAKADGIDRHVKRGLVDMGNSFLASAEYGEAEKYYRQSLELAQNQKDNRNAARALLALSGVLLRQSRIGEANSYIAQALPFYQQAGYRREAMQAFALWARAKYQQGDYTTALQASEKQLELAQQLGDSLQSLLAQADIGITLSAQSKYPEALKRFEESYAIAKALGGKKNIALGLTNRANTLWSLGHYDEARKLLAEAAPLAESADASKNMAAWFYLSSAKMALSERNWSEAKAKAQRASALADAGVRNIALGAMSTGGLAQIYAGALSKGQLDCGQAVRIARETTEPRLIANSLLALAEAHLHNGNSVEALQAALEAAETFSRLGALDLEWIAWSIAARASQGAGQTPKAPEYAGRAQTALAGLEHQWGADNYNSYLNRRDIQFYRKWLSGLPLSKP
jgi:serine/threonine protein kinase/tetratricopeptide (TPR) repeat protein